ncbi:MAG: protein kinase [Planctomycetales bacterium]|nr:protein kinase [Planctomycetales bacterium]
MEGTSLGKLSGETHQRLERLLQKLKNRGISILPVIEHNSSSNSDTSRIIDGKYKLLQQIGSGGMGEVWVAKQLKPVKRRVALKLIKAGMDSKQVVSRFEAERQALAAIDHPNVASAW